MPCTPVKHGSPHHLNGAPVDASVVGDKDTDAVASSELAEALRRCEQLELAERESAALARDALLKLEEAKQAHSEEKQRWLLSSVTIEEEAKARQDDAADAAEKAKEADCLRLSLEEELQKIRNEMAALTVHKDDLLKQVADSDEATIADQRKHHEELSKLRMEHDTKRKQDQDDLTAAERKLESLQKKLSSALALASTSEDQRAALEVKFEKQRADDAKASAAAAERLVSEAVESEKEAARETEAELRSEMKAAEQVRMETLLSKLDKEHKTALCNMEAEASEELSAALENAEKKRKDDLAAAQHGHQVSSHAWSSHFHVGTASQSFCCR